MIDEVTTFISNVGFPIVACFFMFIQNSKMAESLANLSATMESVKDELISLKSKVQ